jgi:hypothetical protein
MTEAVEKAFEDAQSNTLEAVMILGLTENGGLTINSSLNNIAAMHWMLNKSIFDINVYQNNSKPEEQAEEQKKE